MARKVWKRGGGRAEVWADTVWFDARWRYEVGPAAGDAHTVAERVSELKQVCTEIGEVVDWHRQEGLHCLAQGSRWSFGEVVVSQDGILETRGTDGDPRLSQVIDWTWENRQPRRDALHQALLPARQADGFEYVYVEAGIEIDALMRRLDALHLSMITAGSSSGQTLAGVINTGSHGGDFDAPPLADMVEAIVLVGPDGKVRWLESQSDPLTASPQALHPIASVLRDDDAFRAAMVSVGAAGVVVAYVLRVRRAYGLWETHRVQTWGEVKGAIADGSLFTAPDPWEGAARLPAAATYRGVEILINPFVDPGDGDHHAHLVRRAEHPTAALELEDWERDSGGLKTIVRAVLALAQKDRRKYAAAIDQLLLAGRGGTGGFAPAHAVMNYGRTRFEKVWSVDVVLPAERVVAFLDEVLAAFRARIGGGDVDDGDRFGGFLTLRYTRRTRATLGMQNDGDAGPETQRFAHVELFVLQELASLYDDILFDPRNPAREGERFYEDFVTVAERFHRDGALRFHWGQMARSRASYRAPADKVLARFHRGLRTLVGPHRYVFANALMADAGVVPAPKGFARLRPLATGPGARLTDTQRRACAASAPVASPGAAFPVFATDAHGRVSRLGADGEARPLRGARPVDPERSPNGQLAVGVRQDGEAFVAARDDDRHLHWIRADRGWSRWERVERREVGDPAVVSRPAAIAAISSEGLHVWRERGDGWRRADVREPGLVGRPALARASGELLALARATDGALRLRVMGDAKWKKIGARTDRDPGLIAVADRALAVWCTPEGKLSAAVLRADGELDGVAATSADAPGLSGTSGFALAASGPTVTVAFADAQRRVQVRRFELGVGWSRAEDEDVHDVAAVGGPALADGKLLVKVAHDLLAER